MLNKLPKELLKAEIDFVTESLDTKKFLLIERGPLCNAMDSCLEDCPLPSIQYEHLDNISLDICQVLHIDPDDPNVITDYLDLLKEANNIKEC